MRIINKFLKKKHILLTLMFTNYGMDAPDNTQINTENSLEFSSIQQEINSMKKKEFDNFVRIITCRINKIEDLFISIMTNYCSSLKEIIDSMKIDYNNIRDFIEKAKDNYDVEKNTINQNTFKIPETFIEQIIKIFNELSAYYKYKYKTDTLPKDFDTLSIHIKHYIDTMEEYFVFISLDNFIYNNFDNNLLENVLALHENLNIINDLSLTEKEKFLLKKIKDFILLRVRIFNSENNKKENIKPLYIKALNKLKQNPQNINRNKFTRYIKLQERMYSIDPKKQEFDNFFQKVTTIVNNIEKIFNNIISIIDKMPKNSIYNHRIIMNIKSENSLFLYKNIRSFIEKEINNYNPKNYKLNILYQELIPEHDNKIIFTPFLYNNNNKYKYQEKPINFISNIITNYNTLLEFFNEYDVSEKFNDLNIQINEYISTMEKYLFFITIEKYLFCKSSDLFINNFLLNLKTLYKNSKIQIFFLREEEFVLEQFQELIRLRNAINIKEIKSEIPSIIKDYNNNTSTVPYIQTLIDIKNKQEKEKESNSEDED